MRAARARRAGRRVTFWKALSPYAARSRITSARFWKLPSSTKSKPRALRSTSGRGPHG
jgi:hypothetical protein